MSQLIRITGCALFVYGLLASFAFGQTRATFRHDAMGNLIAIEIDGFMPPSDLTVTPGGLQLQLAWTSHSPGADGFKIERWTDVAGKYLEIGTTTVGITAYSDPTVQPDVTYYYRVRAFTNDGRYTAYSNEAIGIQPATAAPSELIVTPVGPQLQLTWTSNSPDADGFKVERKDRKNGTYAEIGSTLVDDTSYADSTVEPGILYYYRVRAYTTAGGFTAYSNEASGVIPAIIPAPSGKLYRQESGTP